MKNLILLFIALSFSIVTTAQTTSIIQKKSTKELLQLDAQQNEAFDKIQLRKVKNLEEILPLKETKPEIYRTKRKAITSGTNASIKMILKEEQYPLFHQYLTDIRIRKSEKSAALKETGADRQTIEDILLEID